MLSRIGLGLAAIAVIAIMGALSTQQGCQDVKKAWTHLAYYPIRDMRTTVVIAPQREMMIAPDSLSVPVGGKDWQTERAVLEVTFHNPEPMSDSSVARGQRKFLKTCIPCHGVSMKGDGPVAAKFVPPPDLLGYQTRARADGYMYSYIRHGGAIMPSYGAQVTRQEAYDLINFIRSMQKKSPR
jgi:mono/diheme cytochrome c family protein